MFAHVIAAREPVKKKGLSRPILALICVGVIGLGAAAYLRFKTPAPPPDYQKLSTEKLRSLTESHPTIEGLGALFQRTSEAGQPAQELELARKMVHLYPGDGRAHNALGIAYAANHDEQSARKAFQNAISLDPRKVDPYINMGRLSLMLGEKRQAATEFDRATTVDAQSAGAWTGLGEAQAEMQNMQEAIDAFQHAIKLAPNRPQAYAHLGTFLAEMGRGEEARPNLTRAMELGDQSATLYAGLAMALADQPKSQEELTQSLAYAEKAEKMGLSDGLVLYAKALALQRLGRYNEAISVYKKVISISSNANGAWLGISQCYRVLGKPQLADQAAKTGERVLSERLHVGNLKHEIQANPNRLDFREQYADVMMSTGQYAFAADQYRYIAQHTPEDPSKWLKAAHAFDLAGEKDLAAYVRQLASEKPSTPAPPSRTKNRPADKSK